MLRGPASEALQQTTKRLRRTPSQATSTSSSSLSYEQQKQQLCCPTAAAEGKVGLPCSSPFGPLHRHVKEDEHVGLDTMSSLFKATIEAQKDIAFPSISWSTDEDCGSGSETEIETDDTDFDEDWLLQKQKQLPQQQKSLLGSPSSSATTKTRKRKPTSDLLYFSPPHQQQKHQPRTMVRSREIHSQLWKLAAAATTKLPSRTGGPDVPNQVAANLA